MLQTITGYQAALEPHAAEAALRRSGYIHLLADERWVPLNARLFAYRQREGAQTVPALVIASILAKKAGRRGDRRGTRGRVALTATSASISMPRAGNAQRYNAVAKLLGLRPVCALTDGTRPYQPYIGRGEALVALAEVLSGGAAGWLADHDALCQRISDAVARALGIDTTRLDEPSALRQAHEALLAAHQTHSSAFEAGAAAIRAAPRTIIRANGAGVIDYDMGRLRALLVARQRAEEPQPGDPPADPAGVILGAAAGTDVDAAQPVMSIRVPDGQSAAEASHVTP